MPAESRRALVVAPNWAMRSEQVRRLVSGIRECAPDLRPVIVYDDDAAGLIQELDEWNPGVVVAIRAADGLLQVLARRAIPVIQALGGSQLPGAPMVLSDDGAAAALAAQAFRRIGARRCAFIGLSGADFSAERSERFDQALAAAGLPPASRHMLVWSDDPQEQRRRFGAAIDALLADDGEGVGVWCANDALAWHLLVAAERRGVAVPGTLAVIGHDDDADLCLMADPPLASIAIPFRAMGWQVAELALRRMSGGEAGGRILVPPAGLTERGSLDRTANGDPVVSAALAWIRDHYQRGIKVPDVAEAVHCSRRVLERRFRQAGEHGVADRIQRTRHIAARNLLADSGTGLGEIARLCGYGSVSHLVRAFAAAEGCSPEAWRGARRQAGRKAKRYRRSADAARR